MKRGRRKQSVEKNGKYEPGALLDGPSYVVTTLARQMKELSVHWENSTRSTGGEVRWSAPKIKRELPTDSRERADVFVENALDQFGYYFALLGRLPASRLAKFFRDFASYIESGRYERGGAYDHERLSLFIILHREYRDCPADLTAIQQRLRTKYSVDWSLRTIGRETKVLGFAVQKRGRR